jgi:carbonic anhydrase
MRTHTKDFFEQLTPASSFEVLKDGNQRFVNNLKINRNLLQLMNETAAAQYPFAVALSCMDSRTSVELIFDQGLGDIFSLRIAGNVVNEDILGSMEYACKVVGSKLILVIGHTRCGAIKGACDGAQMGNLSGLLEKIKPSVELIAEVNNGNKIDQESVAKANVLHSMEEILDKSSIIRGLFNDGKIGIVGGVYSVENGRVDFIKQMFAGHRFEKPSSRVAV